MALHQWYKQVMPVVTGASLLLLAGCGTTAPASTSSSSHADTVVMATAPLQAPNWFFAVGSNTGATLINGQVQSLLYVPLVDIGTNDAPNYSQSIATGVTVNKASDQFIVHLGSKFKWSNGQPVTAQDVVFAWNLIKAASSPHAPFGYPDVGIGGIPADWKSVVAHGSKTVVITTTTPVNAVWFIQDGIAEITPVDKAVWDKYPTNKDKELEFINSLSNSPSSPEYHVVDGAFKFAKMAPNDYWEFVPNPAYGGHKPSIKKFILQYETSTASEFDALKAGTVDLGYLPNSFWGARGELKDDVIKPLYFVGFTEMPMNENAQAPGGLGPVFQHLYMREALQMGIDEPVMIKRLYHGEAALSYGPVASMPKSVYADPATAHAPYAFNPAAGKKLLKAHGWKDVGGVMTKGNLRLAFTVTYISGDATTTDIMELLKVDWAQEGIDVTLHPEELADVDMNQSIDPTKWSVEGPFNLTWGTFYPDGESIFGTGGGSNNGGYSNATSNTLMAAVTTPASKAATLSALFKYEENISKEVPVLWLPWPAGSLSVQGDYLTYSKNLHGVVATAGVSGDIAPQFWTVGH